MELPIAFMERMKKMLGEEYDAFLESYSGESAKGLRVNLLKASPKELAEAVPFHLSAIPWAAEGFYYEEEDRPGKHPFHEAGVYYIQEPSAMAVVTLLDPRPGECLLDLCAAPGGKSSQILSRLKGKGLLISNEIHPARARILSQNIERMGAMNAVVTNVDSTRLAEFFPCFFDRIAVDAPCSGEGMFRKDPEAVSQWSDHNVLLCAERQQEILSNAAEMLKEGGRLVYSTCTFAPQENEQVIEHFLGTHEEFSIEEVFKYPGLSSGMPEWTNHGSEELSKTVRIWPHKTKGEGHFIAVLRKKGEWEERAFHVPSYLKQKELPSEYCDFCKTTLTDPDLWITGKNIILFGEQLYALPAQMPDFDRLKVLRPGLHLGTLRKKRFEPSHALALILREKDVKRSICLRADSSLTAAYLRGETLTGGEEKGWTLITAEGYSIGWGKASGGVIKNHYPKGLRK